MFCSLGHTYYPFPIPLPIYLLLCITVSGIFCLMTINALSQIGLGGGVHPSHYSTSSHMRRDPTHVSEPQQHQHMLTSLTVSAVLAAAEKYCEALPVNPGLGIWSADGKAWFEWLNGRKKSEGCVPDEGICISAARKAIGADTAINMPTTPFQGMKEEKVRDGCGSLLVWT